MPLYTKRGLGGMLLGVLHLSHAYLWRVPALLALLPFALGVWVQADFPQPRLGLVLLSGALLMMCVALVVSPYLPIGQGQGEKVKLRQRVMGLRSLIFTLGLMLTLGAMGMLRKEYAGQRGDEINYSAEFNLKDSLNSQLVEAGVQPGCVPLLSALSLGYLPKTEDNKAMRHRFVEAGVAHLLVVSGYHLALMVYMLAWVCYPLRRNKLRLYHIFLILGTWGFTALTGYGLPTVRAAIMLTLYLCGKFLGRSVYVPNVLAASALFQLIYDPNDLFRWGLWMSYTAVFSIYLFYMPIRKSIGTVKQPILSYLWNLLSLSLSVQVLLLPLLLYLFHKVSWAFVFSTLPLTLLTSLLIPLALLGYALLLCGVPIGFLVDLLSGLSSVTLSIVRWSANLPFTQVYLDLPLWGLLLFWGLAFALLNFIGRSNPSDAMLQELKTLRRYRP